MIETLLNAVRSPEIRRKILFVGAMLVVFRLLSHVPVPGADPAALANFFEDNALFGLLDLFSGGGLARFSVVGLGLNPYINASIIMQLMSGVVPRLIELSREGEYGRNKINQYTRYLTVPLAALQSYAFLALLNSQQVLTTTFDLASPETLVQIVILTTGSLLLMWIGELVTERGIGNGISFIIFAGIIGRVPGAIQEFLAAPDLAVLVAFGAVGAAAVAAIILITEGQRRIPVEYASRVRGNRVYQGGRTFLPLKVNQAGVIPIIFSMSILLFPAQIAGYFTAGATWIVNTLGPQNEIVYVPFYFLLTVAFTYFYTAFTFKADETADQLRKNGGYVPGIRPGKPTEEYLGKVVTRITLLGSLFLGIVAVSPYALGALFGDLGGLGLSLGGTGLLIAVSVVVETMKQLEAQMLMRNYEGFIK
jgi:preprotein translocase subunit SecY